MVAVGPSRLDGMGGRGDLLELIDDAPVGVTSLAGSVWKWTHHGRSRRAVGELTRHRGQVIAFAGSGSPSGETSDQHFRLWVALPDRWRFESDDHLEVRNEHTRWVGSPSHVTEFTGDQTKVDDTEIGMLIASGSRLLGAFKFGEPAEEVVAGRSCLHVSATLHGRRSTGPLDPVVLRFAGVEHRFWFDSATGIVLRHVGLIDDEPCAVIEFKEVSINPPITRADFEFVPPPGTVVEREVEHLIRLAQLRGADLTNVDRQDAQAVRRAIHDAMRPDRPTPADRLSQQMAKHVPVDDPPDDEAAARASIAYAFTHHDEIDEAGTALVNVQSGEGLAGPLQEAQRRAPMAVEGRVGITVDGVLFLRSDEAVVWFSVEIDGKRFPVVNGREGRAVKVGGRWLIERATVVDLLALAGVVAPPPK